MFFNRKCDGAVITKACGLQHKYLSCYIYHESLRNIYTLIGCDAHTLNGYSAHAFFCLSDGEPLWCGCLPSDIFIFNWRVITFTRLHRRALWKHLREEAAPPSAATSSISPPGSGPHSAYWPWWLGDPSHPLFCLFCNKMGCFSLLLQTFHPRPSTEDCGISMYWRLAAGSYYICYSMLWTSKRMKEGLLC